MFQYKMLTIEQLRKFFQEHSIPLQAELPKNQTEVDQLFLAALTIDKVFAAFILNAVINYEKTGIQTTFNSYEEVEEAYTCFLIGYNGTLNN